MKPDHVIGILMLVAATAVGGCASNVPQQTSTPYSAPYRGDNGNSSSYGEIESIEAMHSDKGSTGTGAVVGGLIGGLLGNQVGSGNGRTAATVVGAVGGAVVGNNVERNKNAQASDKYQIRVRLDNGNSIIVVQDSLYDLRIGNRVRVTDGRAYRY